MESSAAGLCSVELAKATLEGANLEGADLSDARLVDTDLSQSNLRGASFKHTTLAHVDFRRANLEEANFVEAWLIGGMFEGARLHNAVFGYTFVSSIISEADGLDEAKHLAGSRVSLDTLLWQPAPSRSFLRGCGILDQDIEYFQSRSVTPLQFFSVFISYSHIDRHLAKRIYSELRSRGIRCWLDSHDLNPGDRILDAVNAAIRVHDRILLCCSRSSLQSWWVQDEVRKALERERRESRTIIIPVLFDRFLIEKWEDGLASDLRSRKAADLTAWPDGAGGPDEFETLVRALRTPTS